MAHTLSSTHYIRNLANVDFRKQAHTDGHPDHFSFPSVALKQELFGGGAVMVVQAPATCEKKVAVEKGTKIVLA